MTSQRVDNDYVLRLSGGEELLESLQKFCHEKNITSGWVTGLGGASHVKLSYFDLKRREYITKEFEETLEVTNITGNIGEKEGETVFHVHATLGREDYRSLAGHVDHLSVAATLELYIRPFSQQLTRKKDETVGLNLLELKE